jgi:hypothetical protein
LQRRALPADEATAPKQVKEMTLDPFNSELLHEHVYCNIIQHFTCKDLLKMSEVSTSWNEIADKRIADKVRFTLKLHLLTAKDLKILRESSRAYKTVKMELVVNERYDAFWSWTGDLRNFGWGDNEDCEDFESYCNKFANLQKQLENLPVIDYDSWLKNNGNLDKIEDFTLNLDYGEQEYEDLYEFYYDDTHRALHSFIAKQKHLKRLDLGDTHPSFLKHYGEKPSFKLESLKGDLYHHCYLQKTQRKSLRTICDNFTSEGEFTVHRYLKMFPQLTKLEMKKASDYLGDNRSDSDDYEFIHEDPTLRINMKIKDLKIRDFEHFPHDFYPHGLYSSTILAALPALDTLNIGRLTLRLMEFIAQNLQVLKILRYETVEDGTLERYEEMKQEEVEGTNTNIECVKI